MSSKFSTQDSESIGCSWDGYVSAMMGRLLVGIGVLNSGSWRPRATLWDLHFGTWVSLSKIFGVFIRRVVADL